MLYLIIERFKPSKTRAVYQRVEEHGRMFPEGLKYVESWVTDDLSACYQIMSCDDRALLDEWITKWDDLVEFEVIPVLTSAEARERVFGV